MDLLALELAEIDDAKEGKAYKNNLLQKHGQYKESKVGAKRNVREDYDEYHNYDEGNKRVKYGEEYTESIEIFTLKH